MEKAVFLDKDGTLIENVPYNFAPSLMVLTEGAGAGLRIFAQLGYRLLVVSNQSGVAKGYFNETALPAVEHRLAELFDSEQVSLQGFYYCPHHPLGSIPRYTLACHCRKPMPGMLWRAAGEHDIDLSASWMIGDILDDVEAGNRAGCKTILIDNGNETEWDHAAQRRPDFMAPDLYAAALQVAQHEAEHGSLRTQNMPR